MWSLMWEDNAKFCEFFRDVHDIFESKCKHGGKEVANPVSIYVLLHVQLISHCCKKMQVIKKRNLRSVDTEM